MTIFEAAIGWLAPPVCIGCASEGEVLCTACAKKEITAFGIRCWRCGAINSRPKLCEKCKSFGGPRHVWVTTQYDGLAKELIRVYKFGQQRAAAGSLARLMKETMVLESDPNMGLGNYLVVPLPTATKRVRQRGFDHSALLAKTIARDLEFQCNYALGRLGQARQLGSQRTTRLKQPEGNYFVRRPKQIKGRDILLVDDVLTTGATLRAATKSLRAAGARHVDALVFAKRL